MRIYSYCKNAKNISDKTRKVADIGSINETEEEITDDITSPTQTQPNLDKPQSDMNDAIFNKVTPQPPVATFVRRAVTPSKFPAYMAPRQAVSKQLNLPPYMQNPTIVRQQIKDYK